MTLYVVMLSSTMLFKRPIFTTFFVIFFTRDNTCFLSPYFHLNGLKQVLISATYKTYLTPLTKLDRLLFSSQPDRLDPKSQYFSRIYKSYFSDFPYLHCSMDQRLITLGPFWWHVLVPQIILLFPVWLRRADSYTNNSIYIWSFKTKNAIVYFFSVLFREFCCYNLLWPFFKIIIKFVLMWTSLNIFINLFILVSNSEKTKVKGKFHLIFNSRKFVENVFSLIKLNILFRASPLEIFSFHRGEPQNVTFL